MSANEKIIIFVGDTKGVKPQHLQLLLRETQATLGGSYLRHAANIADEELVRENERLLTEAGVLNPPLITVCKSAEDEIARVVDSLVLQGKKDDQELYFIDNDPHCLVEAIKNSGCPGKSILSPATLLVLSSTGHFDYKDVATGIRVVSFPATPYRFPTHPTPDS